VINFEINWNGLMFKNLSTTFFIFLMFQGCTQEALNKIEKLNENTIASPIPITKHTATPSPIPSQRNADFFYELPWIIPSPEVEKINFELLSAKYKKYTIGDYDIAFYIDLSIRPIYLDENDKKIQNFPSNNYFFCTVVLQEQATRYAEDKIINQENQTLEFKNILLSKNSLGKKLGLICEVSYNTQNRRTKIVASKDFNIYKIKDIFPKENSIDIL